MMTKTLPRRTSLTSMAILLLLSGATAAFADEGGHKNQAQAFNATMTGGVANFGTQYYYVNGGQLAYAAIAGQTLDPASTIIQYSFFAKQDGLSTSGYAKVQLAGTTANGTAVSLSGSFTINGMAPAVEFPLGCSTNCQSALPSVFLASSPNVQVTVGTSTQTETETLQIESPYFNPWGAPLVLASADYSVVIAATYTQGTILWAGTTLVGTIAGALGSTPASGAFSMTTNELENMVTGTSTDAGSVTYSGMTPSVLNSKGQFTGTSTIPAPTVGSDCSATTGIPGTCTLTGFQSTGSFTTKGPSSMTGTYSTLWGASALSFATSVTAKVSG